MYSGRARRASCRNFLRGSGEITRRQGPTAALALDSEYAAPFAVQWAQSAGDAEIEPVVDEAEDAEDARLEVK